MTSEIAIPSAIVNAMLAHAECAYPQEACGLLGGTPGVVRSHFAITNTLHSPARFNMDGKELLAALDWLDVNSQHLLCIYHSHPRGPAGLSNTDLAEDRYPGVVKIIISGQPGDWHALAFMVEVDGSIREVNLLHTRETI